MIKVLIKIWCGVLLVIIASLAHADDLRAQYVWKSQEQIRSLLGEPNSATEPVGTHAQYVRWIYDDITVTFANGHVIHVFKNDSLHKTVELNENRPD